MVLALVPIVLWLEFVEILLNGGTIMKKTDATSALKGAPSVISTMIFVFSATKDGTTTGGIELVIEVP